MLMQEFHVGLEFANKALIGCRMFAEQIHWLEAPSKNVTRTFDQSD